MEALVLVGGFAAVFVFGYFLMSKLDDWLAEPRSREDRPRTEPQLRIAAYQLDSVPAISAALKELGRQRPGLRCALILGEEQEIAGALARGSVDLALVSDHTAIPSVQYRDITLYPQAVKLSDGAVEVSALGQGSVRQRLLWHNGEIRPDTLELIRRLCGQP